MYVCIGVTLMVFSWIPDDAQEGRERLGFVARGLPRAGDSELDVVRNGSEM